MTPTDPLRNQLEERQEAGQRRGQAGVQRHPVQLRSGIQPTAVLSPSSRSIRRRRSAGPASPARSCTPSPPWSSTERTPRTTSSSASPSSSRTSRSAPRSGASSTCSAPPGVPQVPPWCDHSARCCSSSSGPVVAVPVQQQPGRAGPSPSAGGPGRRSSSRRSGRTRPPVNRTGGAGRIEAGEHRPAAPLPPRAGPDGRLPRLVPDRPARPGAVRLPGGRSPTPTTRSTPSRGRSRTTATRPRSPPPSRPTTPRRRRRPPSRRSRG